MGDFNIAFTEANITFCNECKLKALNKESTCFKNYTRPSCIDLFVTNCSKSFESTLTIETSLSDFHKLIVIVLKVQHETVPLKIIQYRDYKNFDSTRFRSSHQSNFIKEETLTQVFSCEFCEISKNTFFTEHLRTTASEDFLRNFNLGLLTSI